MNNLYGLVHVAQEELITKHCFGDCGKVSLGGVVMTEEVGPLWICCEEVCPHLKKQTEEPFGMSGMTGEPIFLRSIR